jgi:hypothetical protein
MTEERQLHLGAIWSKIELPPSVILESEKARSPWIWYPQLAAPADHARGKQQARKWRRVTALHARQGLCLMGQLFPLYAVPASAETTEWWARSNDLSYVNKFPVALAFWLPPEIEVESQTSYVRTGQVRPPAHIGEIGVVWTGKAPAAYPVALLAEEGLRLCTEIGEAVEGFLSSARSFEEWLAVSEQVQEPVQYLVSLFWQLHQNKHPAQQPLPGLSNIFEGKTHVPFPATVSVEAVLAAYSNADSGMTRWSQQGDFPQYRFEHADGATLVEVRPKKPGLKVDETTSRSLWQRVRNLSDLDGDVLIASLAHYMSMSGSEKDEEGYGVITGNQILDYRGITPIMKKDPGSSIKRRAGHRQEDLAGVSQCYERVISTWVTMRRRKGYSLESPLLLVKQVVRRHTDEDALAAVEDAELEEATLQALIREELGDDAEEHSFVVAWLYRPGDWFKQGASQRRSLAWLCQKALTYDLEKEFWERRLVRYFLFQLRLNAMAGGGITRTISTFFEELSLPVNERDPQKTRNRFEKAMDRLVADHEIAAWEPVPGNPILPRTEWLPIWLRWRILITVAPLIALRPDFADEVKRGISHGLGLSIEAVKQSLEAGTAMGDLAERRHVSLAQLHALELRTFQQASKKAISVGDTTQEIVDDALRQFRREPETLDQFITKLFIRTEPSPDEEGS